MNHNTLCREAGRERKMKRQSGISWAIIVVTCAVGLALGWICGAEGLDSFDQPLADDRECCAWHYGVWYCDHEAGMLRCRDGELSPTCECTCDADGDGALWHWDDCWYYAAPGDPGDCDDANPEAYPGAPELPDNEVDDDCDGAVDEACFLGVVG